MTYLFPSPFPHRFHIFYRNREAKKMKARRDRVRGKDGVLVFTSSSRPGALNLKKSPTTLFFPPSSQNKMEEKERGGMVIREGREGACLAIFPARQVLSLWPDPHRSSCFPLLSS
jgi:hypothetical protein